MDPRAAAVFRVATAAMGMAVFWTAGTSIDPDLAHTDLLRDFYDNVFHTAPYRAAVVVAAGALAIGLRPRLTGLALFMLLGPLVGLANGQQSSQIVLCVVLATCALRSDSHWSVVPGRSRPDAGPMWPVRLIQLQLSVLYLANALSKTTPAYLSGDVLVGLSQTRPNFLVDLSDRLMDVGPITIGVAWAAAGTVAVEWFLGLAFWHPRLRWVAAAVGVGFHLALQHVVRIHLLGWVSVYLYLAFLLDWSGTRPTVAGAAAPTKPH